MACMARSSGAPTAPRAGTVRVADIAIGPLFGDPIMWSFGAVVLDGVAYFPAHGGVDGRAYCDL
jgi:hypothetical protein